MSGGAEWGRKWGGGGISKMHVVMTTAPLRIASAAAARSDLQMKRACEQDDVAVAAQCHGDTARVLAQLEGFAG